MSFALYLCPCGTVFNTDSSFLKIIFGQRSVMMTSQTSFSSVLALFGWVKKYCLICIKTRCILKEGNGVSRNVPSGEERGARSDERRLYSQASVRYVSVLFWQTANSHSQSRRTCPSHLYSAKIFYALTFFVIYRINANKFMVPVIYCMVATASDF